MSSTTRKAAALLMALSLGAAACASDDEESADTTVAEVEETTDDTMEEEAMEDAGTIVDVAVENGSFTTLVAAVEAAGLVDTLSGEGPFTVFAPTDEAFSAALGDLGLTAEDLLADTELLTTILTYHVVSGEVLSTDLTDGMTAATVQGEEVTIDLSEGVQVNGANVISADVDASNGVIHAIDYVLLPPSLGLGDDAMEDEEATEDEGPNLIEVATEAGDFTTLLAAADAAGLTDTLATGTVATIFAPTDEAFAAALESLGLTAEELLADTETLTGILTYHAIGGVVTSADLTEGPVTMLNGLEATISITDGTVMINDATVVTADIEASNGVIHVIDSVLLPPS